MRYYLYVATDLRTGELSPIYSARNDEIARQIFAKMIDGRTLHASTYDLFTIGKFEQNDDDYSVFGIVQAVKRHIVNGDNLSDNDKSMLKEDIHE